MAKESAILPRMRTPETIAGHLFSAELQFRLAAAVKLALTSETQPIDLPMKWSHGKHVVEYKDIALRPDQAQFAGSVLFHSVTFLMAVAVRDAIVETVKNPKDHEDCNVRSAYQISRMIRNSFSHAPFAPIWSIDVDCRHRTFSVRDIISLDTAGLNGQPFNDRHYGGPLALLKLCQFTRFDIVGDTAKRPHERELPEPQKMIFQQGGLVFRNVD